MAYMSLKNLNLTIDSRKLLEDISFDVEKGSLTLVAGRNGSGKSLLLKCLKGLEKPDSGIVTIDGKELKKTKERMKTFGLVFQDTSLQIVGSTVAHDIAFG
ncbi:MAG: ATP-binding cassette domain-containing protein, partial [Spirochaetales bacterium]|nr:ATP-binding cassette domain-containing protein [Candidatus Physcosoma equi]